MALAALLLAPGAALADNECDPVGVDPALSPGADTFTCDQDSYPSVTYNADGDLTLDVVGGGADTVTLTDGDSATDGFSLTATGGDALTLDSSTVAVEDNDSDVVLDAATETGNIVITTDFVDSGTGAAYGIRAQSAGSAPGAGDGGDITITTGRVAGGAFSGNANGADVGIEAVTAGGGVAITNHGLVNGDDTGIRVDTRGGDGAVLLDVHGSVGDADTDTAIDVTTGTGPMTVNVHAEAVINCVRACNTATSSGTAIRTDAGGDAEINILEKAGSLGGLEFNETTIFFGDGELAVDMTAAADTTTTLNIARMIGEGRASALLQNDVPVLGGGGAGRIVINMLPGSMPSRGGELNGGLDFAANTGGVTFNNLAGSGGWAFEGDAVTFGSGDDTVNNMDLILPTSGGRVRGEGLSAPRRSTVAFGPGHDVFNNAGILLLGDAVFRIGTVTTGLPGAEALGDPHPIRRNTLASEATFEDLEAFHNSGLIVLGGYVYGGGSTPERNDPDRLLGIRFVAGTPEGEAICRQVVIGGGLANPPADGFPCTAGPIVDDTDNRINDVLSLPGTAFTGSGDSRIRLDAAFGFGTPQTRCQPGDDDRAGMDDRFALPGADCVDIRNGSTAGSTQIIVRDALPGDLGAYNPDGIVIVDVSGGTSHAGDFTLSPDSEQYATTAEGIGVIDKGLFAYPLLYDAATQQHKLVGTLSYRAFQMPLLGHAAQTVSRQAAAGGFQRQDALRRSLRAGNAPRGGFWGNIGYRTAERDVRQSNSALGQSFTFTNNFDQDTSTLTLGRDFSFGATDNGAWTVGGSVGYVRSRLSFDNAPTRADFDGVTAGVYGSYLAGALYVDASLHGGYLQVDYDDPAFSDPGEDDNELDNKATTLNASVETGWRLDLTDRLHVTPLASLSWIRADFDDLDISSNNAARPDNTVVFDTPTSFRGGLGARLGLDAAVGSLGVQYNLAARVWNEFDGESDVTLENGGPDVAVGNEFDGTFTELVAGIDISSPGDALTGYLNANGTFGDDYDSLGAELGFRYQW